MSKDAMIWSVKNMCLLGRSKKRYYFGDPVPAGEVHRINTATYTRDKKLMTPEDFRKMQEKSRPKPKAKPAPKPKGVVKDGDKENTGK